VFADRKAHGRVNLHIAGRDLSLVAGNDLSLSVATLKAGGSTVLQAGNDLTLGAVQSGTHWSTQTQGSSVDAGGSLMLLQAGHDLGVQAGSLSAGGAWPCSPVTTCR